MTDYLRNEIKSVLQYRQVSAQVMLLLLERRRKIEDEFQKEKQQTHLAPPEPTFYLDQLPEEERMAFEELKALRARARTLEDFLASKGYRTTVFDDNTVYKPLTMDARNECYRAQSERLEKLAKEHRARVDKFYEVARQMAEVKFKRVVEQIPQTLRDALKEV